MATSYDYKELTTDFHNAFGSTQCLDMIGLDKLQRCGWHGQTCMSMRGVSWRLWLGILPANMTVWPQKMEQNYNEYEQLKTKHLPDINQVQVDPLSGMCSGEHEDGQRDGDWDAYYKKLDVVKFIQGDLERLYLNGIDIDEYFQQPARARSLLNVLFIWAEQNPQTSGYRQGMHEIVAPVLLVLEAEASLWSSALISKEKGESEGDMTVPNDGPDSAIVPYFSDEKYIESSMYWIFERIMQDLDYLYKPPARTGEQPGVVQFCSQVQDEMLRALDPDLCVHLEDNYVQAQLYGMRWSRLLLGREFEVVEESLFRIWDYIFASSLRPCISENEGNCQEQETSVAKTTILDTQEGSTTTSDPLFNTPAKNNSTQLEEEDWPTSSAAMKARRKARFEKPSLMLESLADFMLAMLLHIRDDLLDGDNSTTLQLLMRYPPLSDITPIIDLVDMIRRGVLDSNSHVGAKTEFNEGDATATTQESDGGSSRTPTWLWRESSTNSDHHNESPFSIRKNLKGVTMKMGQKISSVVSATAAISGGNSSAEGVTTTTTPKRRVSAGTRNSLFGTGRRKSKENTSRALFDDSPLGDDNAHALGGGKSMEALDKRIVEEEKSSVVVTQEIIRIALLLESWTADKSRPDATTVIPPVVSRLRQLSGLLDHSLTLAEYTTMDANGNGENGNASSSHSADIAQSVIVNKRDSDDDSDDGANSSDYRRFAVTVESHQGTTQEDAIETTFTSVSDTPSLSSLNEDKKDEKFGKDFFASTFGLLDTEKTTSEQHTDETSPSDILLMRKDKNKRDESKIDAIFSDLTGDKKTTKPSPFDDPFFSSLVTLLHCKFIAACIV